MDKFYIETITATLERTIRRLWILCVLLALLCAAAVSFIVWRETQFQDEIITIEQEADGPSRNFAIGGDLYGFEATRDD